MQQRQRAENHSEHECNDAIKARSARGLCNANGRLDASENAGLSGKGVMGKNKVEGEKLLSTE